MTPRHSILLSLPSLDSIMSFFDDDQESENDPFKQEKRLKYLQDALALFTERCHGAISSPKTAEEINIVYWNMVLPSMKKTMTNPQGRIDHHKIISGTQCAVMATNLIRTQDTVDIKKVSGESKRHDTIRTINARFALYLALDILKKWNDIDLGPLTKRNVFIQEHLVWLNTTAILNKRTFHFPFFAISQLWYLAEQLCLCDQANHTAGRASLI